MNIGPRILTASGRVLLHSNGKRKSGTLEDCCCDPAPIDCSGCTAYTGTSSAITVDPTNGTRGYITDISLDTPSDSTLACLVDGTKSTIYGALSGWRTSVFGNAFRREKAISLTVCSLTFTRVVIASQCASGGRVLWTITLDNGLGVQPEFRISVTTPSNIETVGTCCDFTSRSATGTTPWSASYSPGPGGEALGGSISFSVSAGTC